MPKKTKIENKDLLSKVVKNSLCRAEVLRKLGLRPVGGNYKTLKKYLKLFEIDTSHFTGQGWNVGNRFTPFFTKKPLSKILKKNSPFNTSHLRVRLIKEGLKEAKCEVCGLMKWNGKKILLELNHINGINDDNRIENLEVVCPNCHAQTNHYRGKSKKVSAIVEKREVELRKFRETLTENADGNPEPSLVSKEGAETLHGASKSIICRNANCDNPIKSHSKSYCSMECYRADSSKRPDKDELLSIFFKTEIFCCDRKTLWG